MAMKSHGINHSDSSPQLLSDMMNPSPVQVDVSTIDPSFIKAEPEANMTNLANEIIMEDSSPVSGDPMMSQIDDVSDLMS